MLNEKIQNALNAQVNAELYSAYLYLAMNAYFESIDLTGCAAWMRAQAQEEMMHAMKIYDFINERGGRIHLPAIDAPPMQWPSALAAFEEAYKHEQKVTSLINKLVDQAVAQSDHATHIFLQWFVSEQVEEEASVSAVVKKMQMAGESGGGLFMIDNELGQRIFTMPPATA